LAYDEDLANRIREQLADERFTEKAMFGGLAFLVGGHMTVAASRTGGMLVRVDPEKTGEALDRPHTSLMEMRGRRMPGWLLVAPEGVRTKRDLGGWVRRSLEFVHSLPPKG
jgi:TfoX-like protein